MGLFPSAADTNATAQERVTRVHEKEEGRMKMELPSLSVVFFVIVLIICPASCRGTGEKAGKASRCEVREPEGDVSAVCHIGGPPTLFPPDCNNNPLGSSLVINSLVLANKPGCHGPRCCQANSNDKFYSVPCLAEVESSPALTSLERAVLVGCSGHRNCSVAQVLPIPLPGLGPSAYLKVTSSCVQATPANTIHFCSNQTLRAASVFLRYAPLPANFTENFECTCAVQSKGNTTARALAVRQRETGSWLAFVGRTDQSVIERKIGAFDTVYGENTDVFTHRKFTVTLGPLQSGSQPLVWLAFSATAGDVTIECRPPVATKKEFSHGSSSAGAAFSVTAVVVGVVVALILLLGLALVCISRTRRRDKAYNCRENEEKIVVVPMDSDGHLEDTPEGTILKETDPIIYGRASLAPTSKPPRRPDITYDLPLYGITELYSQVASASAAPPKLETSEGTYAVPNGGLCDSGDASVSSCSADCQTSCEASGDNTTPSSEVA